MAFRWRADDGPILVAFGSTIYLNKNVVKVGPPLKKHSGSTHGFIYFVHFTRLYTGGL